MDNFDWRPSSFPGYRLKKLELTNWGTFDSTRGQVYSLDLSGKTALLVGQNGSGKSTLVDTLLTLLVQPGVRNYNVAAGAKKRERDERTYIRGACGRSSDEEAGSVIDYLRPDDKHYSVLLACFERATTGDAFSVVQVLQILGDGEVDKTYGFAEQEMSIAEHLSGLSRSEKIRKQLISRGFKATSKYSEYFPWIARKTHMRPKAMDIFNQTVAVKDIQSLNRFIREHMLEAKPWRDRIDNLLNHFSQLSQAHQSLVRARRQIELLQPIESAAQSLGKLNSELSLYQQQLDATDSYFRLKMVDWLRPRLESNQQQMGQAADRRAELEQELEFLEDSQRSLRNEIDSTGGDRMRQIPHQLHTQQTLLKATRRERNRLLASLKAVGIDYAINNRKDFEQLPNALADVQAELSQRSTEIAQRRLELARELTQVRGSIEEETSQLQFLQQQPGNLPEWLADVRASMLADLDLAADELPFVCELVAVAEDAVAWQPAIESVLRKFALSLLVPERHYRLVGRYIETHELRDNRGRGQRLVYLRVPTQQQKGQSKEDSLSQVHQDSMIRKLRVRDGHPFGTWIYSELARRFDFRCCDDVAQFQRSPGLAMTQQRHIKFGKQHHEKDDRSIAINSRNFVLGWDNAERLQELRESLNELKHAEANTLSAIQDLEADSKRLSGQLAAIDSVLTMTDYDSIDVARFEAEIRSLENERRAIEDSNDAVRVLRERLEDVTARKAAAQQDRDSALSQESGLLNENERSQHILEKYESQLAGRRSDGSWNEHAVMFDSLEESLGERLGRVREILEFSELQNEATHQLQQSLNQLNHKAEPLQADIVRSMQRFLSDSPEEKADLRADLTYLEGFLGLLEQLRRDDLPRYEKRFQQRLNEKVIQELGVFHAALQCERQEIEAKISTLNQCLQQMEYRAGTYMRLEPRKADDREIKDFQALIRSCLEDGFDEDEVANEERYQQIQHLIQRLRDEERWRDKVTDVRRWFNFAAREIDVISGQERGCYEDSSGQSGGEKAKLAFTILVAAIAYQFDIDPAVDDDDRFHFVVVDEMFSKVDDRYADYALQLFEKFGLQLLIVAPLDAKARVTEPYVGCYLHTVKNEQTRCSEIISLTAEDYESAVASERLVKPR